MPELRKDYVTDTWVVFSAARAQRPGAFRGGNSTTDPEKCPFCYGHEHMTPPEVLAYRKDGVPNGTGWWIRCVPNKSPALQGEGGRVALPSALAADRHPDRAAADHGGSEFPHSLLRVDRRILPLLRDCGDGDRGGDADCLGERIVRLPVPLRGPVPVRNMDPAEGPRDGVRGYRRRRADSLRPHPEGRPGPDIRDPRRPALQLLHSHGSLRSEGVKV